MTKSSIVRKCLFGSMAGVGLLATAGMGTAHATEINDGTSQDLSVAPDAVAKCVKVVVPSLTADVVASLKVEAAGVKSNTQKTTSVTTDKYVANVCVYAAAEAVVTLDAQAHAGVHGTTVHVNACVFAAAEADADVAVTVNGKKVL